MWSIGQGVTIALKFITNDLKKLYKIFGLRVGCGILPVNIQAIKAKVLEEFYGGLSEVLSSLFCRSRSGKVRRVRPTSDRKEYFQIPISFFQEIELLYAAIDIIPDIIPGICRIMLLNIGPGIGEVNLPSFWANVGESIEYVRQFLKRNVLRLVISTVDGPINVVCYAAVARMTHRGRVEFGLRLVDELNSRMWSKELSRKKVKWIHERT